MKKTDKVSIADISFTLDNDAYISLKQYLDSLHAYYDKDPDGSEIIADIEARIAELILNEQVYTRIVTKQLIDSIIAQLGTPEEIEEDAQSQTGGAPAVEPSFPRRLYRSYEAKIFGGVCSGMSQFWNVSVAWMRLAFLSPFIIFIITAPFDWGRLSNFFLGWTWVFAVIYVVLWMAIPMAKSPRQKLEARGEKITPSSIRQNLQEGATTPSSKKAASVLAEILAVLGRVLLFFIKFVVGVIGFTFIITSLVILIAMFLAPFGVATPTIAIMGWEITSMVGLTLITPLLFAELLLFCIMVPLFVVGMAFLSLVFNWKLGKVFFGVLLGIWLLAMIFCTVVVASNARYLRSELRDRDISIGWSAKGSWRRDHKEGRKIIIREIREGAGDREINVEGLSIDVAKDSLVVIVKKQRDGAENDTLTVGESEGEANRIVIKRTDD